MRRLKQWWTLKLLKENPVYRRSDDLCLITDQNGHILHSNRAANLRLDLSEDEHVRSLVEDEDWERIDSWMEGKYTHIQGVDLKGLRDSFSLKVFRDGPCRVFLFEQFLSDEDKMLLQEQRKWAHNLKIMLFGISHELKTPLATARGYAQCLRDHPDKHDPEVYEKILSSLDRIGNVLTDVTRPVESMKKEGGGGYTPLRENIRQFEKTAEVMETTKKFVGTFDVDVDEEGEPYMINMQKSRLFQVLTNLFENAQQATQPKEDEAYIGLRTAECEKDHHRDRCVVVVFEDNGVGMDEVVREQVFTPYFTTHEEGTGSGLGGYFIYKFVREAGGVIDIESKPGEGTTFYIHLPFIRPEDLED